METNQNGLRETRSGSVGWVIGGYLMAAILGIANGAKPTGLRKAATRVLGIIPYAIVSGLGGVLFVAATAALARPGLLRTR